MIILASAVFLRTQGWRFDHAIEVIDRPIFEFAALYFAAAVVFLVLVAALNRVPRHLLQGGVLPGFLFAVGFGCRVVMFGSEPVQEIDYYRYLWDGALLAHGINPWAYAPGDILSGRISDPSLDHLVAQGRTVLERINYAELNSIYPPTAQFLFAAAAKISLFSLDAWRFVLLVMELITLGCLVSLLRHFEKPVAYAAVYWLNPVAIKEVMNSGHMEPALMVPVLLCLVFAVRRKWIVSTVMLALATAAKLWPLALLPLLVARMSPRMALQAGSVGIFALLLGVLFVPMIIPALNSQSGLLAFSSEWERISLSFMLIQNVVGLFTPDEDMAGVIARGIVALLVAATLLVVLRRGVETDVKLLTGVLTVTAAILLLSPVQLPWYFLWVLPLLCQVPVRGLLLIGAVVPLYYVFFELTAVDTATLYLDGLIVAMWLPVWLVLLWDGLHQRKGPDTPARPQSENSMPV